MKKHKKSHKNYKSENKHFLKINKTSKIIQKSQIASKTAPERRVLYQLFSNIQGKKTNLNLITCIMAYY